MALHHAQDENTGLHRPSFPASTTDPTTLYTVPEGAIWPDSSTDPPTFKEYISGAWVVRLGPAKVHDHNHTATTGDGGDLDSAKVGDFLEFAEASTPSTPATGLVRVYAKADGNLYQKDDAGTETSLASGGGGGAVATDTIWDAKGDLAVGTGADTAAKLGVGSNGQVLTADSTQTTGLKWAAASGSGFYSAAVIIRDEKTAGTASGGFTSGAWRTRDLNTEVLDTGSYASVASNQISLAAGTWDCLIFCPAYYCGNNKTRLRNITDSADLAIGQTAYAYRDSTDGVNSVSIIVGTFTIAATKTLEVQHWCGTTQATNGFGAGVIGTSGTAEVYTVAMFWKRA